MEEKKLILKDLKINFKTFISDFVKLDATLKMQWVVTADDTHFLELEAAVTADDAAFGIMESSLNGRCLPSLRFLWIWDSLNLLKVSHGRGP